MPEARASQNGEFQATFLREYWVHLVPMYVGIEETNLKSLAKEIKMSVEGAKGQ